MATHSFVAYDASAITIGAGTLELDAGLSFATQTTMIVIDDEDAYFDGDADANEGGDDSNQYNSGTTDRIYAEERYGLSNGTEVTRVEVGGVFQGYILNGPQLTPGVIYTISHTQNVDEDNGDAFSVLDDVTCFVAGTGILTPRGEVPVENLMPGDRVITLDHGIQTVRGFSQRTVLAVGKLAPIRLRPGLAGNSRDLLLSPQHRVLLRGSYADLFSVRTKCLQAPSTLSGTAPFRKRRVSNL